MKAHLERLVQDAGSDAARRQIAREYLQARILQSLQDQGMFVRWAFLGGTALRFLFDIPRFSEDLDFSMLAPAADSGLRNALDRMTHALEAEGYRLEVTIKDKKTVASSFVKFPGLPHDLGLSQRAEQALSVKIEVDTNPPPGASIETTIVRRHVTLRLCHYDKASLLAGKLHAILDRPWAKGRDIYDLAWYLADRSWPAPNLQLLNAALAQTGWAGPAMTAGNWRQLVRERLLTLDWTAARNDAAPFLEHEHDLQLVSADALDSLLVRG